MQLSCMVLEVLVGGSCEVGGILGDLLWCVAATRGAGEFTR